MPKNTEQIFTDSELSANDERKKKLIQLIVSGDSILLVGAGSSKICGFPLWGELLEIFEDEIDKLGVNFVKRDTQSKDLENDIVYAARLRTTLGDGRYFALLNQVFEGQKYSQCHSTLVSLPFRGILTTNFDHVLESALGNKLSMDNISVGPLDLLIDDKKSKREIYKFLKELNEKKDFVNKIAHLHGTYRDEPSIVLCSEDYKTKYGIELTKTGYDDKDKTWTLTRKILWALMSTRRIIYLGFSMNDDYFKIMHDIVCKDLGSYGQDTHFLIERITSKREFDDKRLHSETIKQNYGVETVFYVENTTKTGLEQFISELESETTKLLKSKTQKLPENKIKSKSKRKEKVNDDLNKQLTNKALQNSNEN